VTTGLKRSLSAARSSSKNFFFVPFPITAPPSSVAPRVAPV
jgi:hypothetical protein